MLCSANGQVMVMNERSWEKTNGVTADEGELSCKAFVLKALTWESN